MLRSSLYLCIFLCVFTIINIKGVRASTFDNDLYERVLDSELCNKQLNHMTLTEPGISFAFYDAGFRMPRGVLTAHLSDWGNYHQCLRTAFDITTSVIEGKYCAISIPFHQELTLATWTEVSKKILDVDDEVIEEMKKMEKIKHNYQTLINGRSVLEPPLDELSINLGMCIPKVCTTKEVFDFITLNGLLGNISVNEQYCRLPNDKPFVAVDYVAIALFSIVGLLMILSTTYDLYQTIVLKKDSKNVNKLLSSFSVYTNSRRLLTFTSSRDALHCLDGIRAIAMFWVVYGHVFGNYALSSSNILDLFMWAISWTGSTLLVSAPITVDTFFMMSGLLLVYSMAGKLTQRKFLTKIHMFYILRYLRLFPILAIAVLMQASVFHHISDGPRWHNVVIPVQFCRDNWWSTFLFVANYVNSDQICLSVTWYMMVEMQLFWISPLVLIWVLSRNKRTAWLALGIALFLSLVSVSVFCFIYDFPSSFLGNGDPEVDYFRLYYVNTLTRASPFFVGMIVGYVLHLWRGQEMKIPKIFVLILWALAAAGSSFIIFITHPIIQPNYYNQSLDIFLNAYSRGIWAAALGWLIIACVHGYGGPINWFLSLNVWKLPARLSYAMYLLHMPIMQAVAGSLVSPVYYTEMSFMYRFMADSLLTFILSYVITIAVDSPFSTLQKLVFNEGLKSSKQAVPKIEITKHESETTNATNEKMHTKI